MGAREEIYKAIAKLAETGCAILMISSDMEELLGMSHRIAVMREGSIAGILDKEAFGRGYYAVAVREDLATTLNLRNNFHESKLSHYLNRYRKEGCLALVLLFVAFWTILFSRNTEASGFLQSLIESRFLSLRNLENLSRQVGMYGIFSLGMGLVIISVESICRSVL